MLLSDYSQLELSPTRHLECTLLNGGIIDVLKSVTLLGSTGSIGIFTLDVIRRSPERFQVFALVAGQNAEALASQILEFRPRVAVVATTNALANLTKELHAIGLPRSEW